MTPEIAGLARQIFYGTNTFNLRVAPADLTLRETFKYPNHLVNDDIRKLTVKIVWNSDHKHFLSKLANGSYGFKNVQFIKVEVDSDRDPGGQTYWDAYLQQVATEGPFAHPTVPLPPLPPPPPMFSPAFPVFSSGMHRRRPFPTANRVRYGVSSEFLHADAVPEVPSVRLGPELVAGRRGGRPPNHFRNRARLPHTFMPLPLPPAGPRPRRSGVAGFHPRRAVAPQYPPRPHFTQPNPTPATRQQPSHIPPAHQQSDTFEPLEPVEPIKIFDDLGDFPEMM
ncbi:hypothetical protein BCR34DRAFT_588900 [Clohesyomyces aquaticus]|uniref:Uncharacterized protein n=1 Tax=Clohesyomyces aquaticus TaxID=1231657 RepID=A0A1Y1ZIJ7_9PLEO|nr:hypothetical protein BCR34DRAFT_588900 [Clohesyomyces aquaticus]